MLEGILGNPQAKQDALEGKKTELAGSIKKANAALSEAQADLVFMVGLRAHTSYLGDPEGSSISCFDLLVPHLFDV